MAFVLVRHSVEDWSKWKSAYDNHGEARQAAGCRGTQVFRNADDPNNIVVILEWDSLENARSFSESDDLREAMERAGVTGPPDITFISRSDVTDS